MEEAGRIGEEKEGAEARRGEGGERRDGKTAANKVLWAGGVNCVSFVALYRGMLVRINSSMA